LVFYSSNQVPHPYSLQAENLALAPTAAESAKITPKPGAAPPPVKRKGPKGPNPLSIKKKSKVAPPKPIASDKGKIKDRPAGLKRKREADEGVAEEARGDLGLKGQETRIVVGAGHKRKRRRKGESGNTGSRES
jgi:U3 small nucleolar RNA-associated protein 23